MDIKLSEGFDSKEEAMDVDFKPADYESVGLKIACAVIL